MEVFNIFHNANARSYKIPTKNAVSPRSFHVNLPGFKQTPLIQLPKQLFGLEHVYVKDESERLGLPSFKILGASWGTFRSITSTYGLPVDSDLEIVRHTAQQHDVHLITATDGNHGRAIAYMARVLGVASTVFVPDSVNTYTRNLIASEGATVHIEACDYDTAVMSAYKYAQESPNRLFIQDTSFEGYDDIPTWIVQGYETMFREVEEQLRQVGIEATHMLTPVGVGSLAHAVVTHCKSQGRTISVTAVESKLAPCLQTSLRNGSNTSIATKTTIMDGINCGTVSSMSWPILKDGIDGSLTISDAESHEAVLDLAKAGVNAGPCGASTFAALKKVMSMPDVCSMLGIQQDSVIVLLNTEGPREYTVPH